MELAASEAQVKRLKARVTNLEESLDARQRENQELMNICDELVAKVGNKAA